MNELKEIELKLCNLIKYLDNYNQYFNCSTSDINFEYKDRIWDTIDYFLDEITEIKDEIGIKARLKKKTMENFS